MRVDYDSYKNAYKRVINDFRLNQKDSLSKGEESILKSFRWIRNRSELLFGRSIVKESNNFVLIDYITQLFNGSYPNKDKENRFYILDTSESIRIRYQLNGLSKLKFIYGRIVPNLNLLKHTMLNGEIPVWYTTDVKPIPFVNNYYTDYEILDELDIDFTIQDIIKHLDNQLKDEDIPRVSQEPKWNKICDDIESRIEGDYELIYYTEVFLEFGYDELFYFEPIFKNHPNLKRISIRSVSLINCVWDDRNEYLNKSPRKCKKYQLFKSSIHDCGPYTELRMLRTVKE